MRQIYGFLGLNKNGIVDFRSQTTLARVNLGYKITLRLHLYNSEQKM